jgi:S-formylglutathione hydrolase FrmB
VAIDSVSLLHGMLPRAVLTAAGVCWLVCLARRDRRWWRVTLPLLTATTAVVVAAAAVLLRGSGRVTDHYPPTFTIWVGMAVLAPLACAAGFRRSGAWRRGAALGAVPLTIAAAFVLINSHYGYWPTVGDLLGRRLPDQVTSARVASLSHRVGGAPAVQGAEVHPATTVARHGQLLPLDLAGTVSHFSARRGSIYLPPAFFAASHPSLPVVVMLAGTPSDTDAWPRAGFAIATADDYAATHHGIAPILAFVDQNGSFTGDTECVDGPAGNAETFLTVDVPRTLATVLHVPLNPRRWAVAGFSEGGTCALDLALRHPDVYGGFVDLAGDQAPILGLPQQTLKQLYGGSLVAMMAHDPVTLLRQRRTWPVVGWFAVGASDHLHVAVANRLAQDARAAGMQVDCSVLPGAHNWQFAAAAFREVLPALAGQLGATET